MYNCFIIGYPLKKPRSVVIWKKYFKKNKIKSTMDPLEVKISKLSNFIKKIKKNKNFLATAVTSPLKILSYKFIKPGDKISKSAKSVNLIIKKKEKLYGYNTDIISLIQIIKKYKKNNILIIGLGGVGMPLYNVLSKIKKYKISVLTRNKNNPYKYKNCYNSFDQIKSNINLVINCTPLGSNLKKNYINKTPISNDIIKNFFKKKVRVLDIIYKPKNTVLNKICKKYGISYSNGIEMNTLQAKIALKLINNNLKKI